MLIVKKFIKYWEKGFIYIPMTTPLKVTLLIYLLASFLIIKYNTMITLLKNI